MFLISPFSSLCCRLIFRFHPSAPTYLHCLCLPVNTWLFYGYSSLSRAVLLLSFVSGLIILFSFRTLLLHVLSFPIKVSYFYVENNRYGSFVERSPEFGGVPSNFFGRQVVGTALVDAARIEKQKPFGARILVSPSAFQHWPETEKHLVIWLPKVPKKEIEYLPERPKQFDLFDCIYYLLCLRDHPEDTNSFRHYIWSIASRCARLGSDLGTVAAELVAKEYNNKANFETVLLRVNEVICIYRKAQKADSHTSPCS
jgi:hypothetical protein